MNEPRLKILPPWTIVIRKLEALFDGDPQIAVSDQTEKNDQRFHSECYYGVFGSNFLNSMRQRKK